MDLIATFGQDPNINTSDIKFPDGRYSFPASSILSNKGQPRLGFSTEGMVDKGNGIVGYGTADISDYLNDKSDNYISMPTTEYMSRLTGIPKDIQLKFIDSTNTHRAAIPPMLRFLRPVPNTLRIARNSNLLGLVGDASSASHGAHSFNLTGQPNYIYTQKNKPIPLSYKMLMGLPGTTALSLIKQNLVYNGMVSANEKLTPAQIREGVFRRFNNTDSDFAEVIKHEVGHLNTGLNINFPLQYGDLRRYMAYNLMSPSGAFSGNRYFAKPAEAWGAANRIKNDAAGLYYKKYGHLPGFDLDGNELLYNLDEKKRLVSEALDMYFSKDNPGRYNRENRRIRNQLHPKRDPIRVAPDIIKKVIPGDLSLKEWMLSNPMGEDSAIKNTLMWDLAHSGNGNMNKTASANLTGLYKAASQVKEAGKIMVVKVTKMDTHLGRLKMRAHYVYMPDCAAYRDIITNGSAKKKAALANKFWLNQTPACVLVGCELEVVDKS